MYLSKSYCHRGGAEPLLGLTIPEHFHSIVDRFPNHEAVVSVHQDRRVTYAALAARVDTVARGLLGLGFGKGDRIGIWSTNNLEWILLQMATARIGIILVNINPAYRPKEVAYALRRSDVQGLFTIPSFRTSDYVEMLAEIMPDLRDTPCHALEMDDFPNLRRVVLYDPADPPTPSRPFPGFTTWEEVTSAAEGVEPDALDEITSRLDPDDPVNIQYTSGTTGFPKAVVLTHNNILNNALFCARGMQFTERDRLCVPVPFYHCFGMVASTLMCFSVGAGLVVPGEYFDPLETLSAVANERCTALHGVPTMFIAQLDLPEFQSFDLSSLRTGIMAGAPCPAPLLKRVMQHCPEILIGYGQTEASPVTHLTAPHDSLAHRVETVGTNLPHQETKIIDVDLGTIVPVGEPGEICFRGYHVMKGYYGDPEASRETIDEGGWLHSGDVGVMDHEGYVRITGRIKEMIIRGGENIYPREIEDVIFSHPDVAEVAVVGVPDEFYGEEVMAWIQMQDGKIISEEEIRQYCRERIARFKIPKYLWFVNEFPMTVTGKVQKFRMRTLALAKMRSDEPVNTE